MRKIGDLADSGLGVRMRGILDATVTRTHHVHQLPLFSRRMRVLTDGLLSRMFRRDMTGMAFTKPPRRSRP
jgi:hypothetical protein